MPRRRSRWVREGGGGGGGGKKGISDPDSVMGEFYQTFNGG